MEKITERYNTPKFTDLKLERAIHTWLRTNLKESFQPDYDLIASITLDKVQRIFENWLQRLRERAQKGEFEFTLHPNIHPTLMAVLGEQFLTKMGLLQSDIYLDHYVSGGISDVIDDRFLNQETKSKHFLIPCYWTPDNIYLYEHPLKPKRYDTEMLKPDHNSVQHYREAQNGEKGVDIILKSSEGEHIHAHLLYLNRYTNYFQTYQRFQNTYESQDTNAKKELCATLPFDIKTLLYMREFIYLGTISETEPLDLDQLIQLLKLSHEFMITNLYDYVIDLINDRVEKRPLNKEQIIEFLQCGSFFDEKDFWNIGLKAAEKLSFEEIDEIFERIKEKEQYITDLLVIASEQSLEKVSTVLARKIKELMSDCPSEAGTSS